MSETDTMPYMVFYDSSTRLPMKPDFEKLTSFVAVFFGNMIRDQKGESFSDIQLPRFCNLNDFKGMEEIYLKQQKMYPDSLVCPNDADKLLL